MWKTISSLTLLLLLADGYLLNFLADISQNLHEYCLDLIPKANNPYTYDYAAMLCGITPESSQFNENLKIIGLFHLLVVSGSHLVFLEQMLTPLLNKLGKYGQLILFIFLLLFTLACQLNPPILRALINFMLRKLSDECRLFWLSSIKIAVAGAVCLITQPNWMESTSLQLSWTASLLISWPKQSGLNKNIIIYLGVLPIISGWQILNPATAIVNWLFGPIIGFILFPICIAVVIAPPLLQIGNVFWHSLYALFDFIALYTPVISEEKIGLGHLTWLYVLTLQIWHYKSECAHKKSGLYD